MLKTCVNSIRRCLVYGGADDCASGDEGVGIGVGGGGWESVESRACACACACGAKKCLCMWSHEELVLVEPRGEPRQRSQSRGSTITTICNWH